jgi:hypothetical protein
MSSPENSDVSISSAEGAFRDAFQRLQIRAPIRLPKRSAVSQKNVALEAGKDPSALKKSRFPTLVDEIKRYVEANEVNAAKRDELKAAKTRIAKLELDLKRALELRDDAISKLHVAELVILELRASQHQ